MGWQRGAAWLSDESGWYKIVSAAPPSFSLIHVGDNSDATSKTIYSFLGQGIGAANSTRIVVVAIAYLNNVVVSTVTIGGVTATQATGAAVHVAGGSASDIWYLAVPLGTTADIVVTLASAGSRLVIGVFSVVGTGASFASPGGNGSGATTTIANFPVTIPSGGGAVGIITVHNTTPAIVPVGLTADTANLIVGGSGYTIGHNTSSSGSTNFGASWTGSTDGVMSVAAFNP